MTGTRTGHPVAAAALWTIAAIAGAWGAEERGARFVDVTAPSGLVFQHTHGRDAEDPTRYYIETMCGGVAFVDFDGDGHQDIYGVNGQYISAGTRPRARNRLFLNLGDGTFRDLTDSTAAGDEGYGMGVAAGDYDSDGRTDLYVTNYGPNALLRNDRGRRFLSLAPVAAVADSLWGVGAGFLDYDGDGDLDLYVANYVDYDLEDAHRQLRPYVARGHGAASVVGYPHPDNFDGAPDVLYRNDGGSFTDVTRAAGVFNPAGKGMGIAIADYDDDGDVDVFVANDRTGNFLYENGGDGRFADVGLISGTAFDRDGRPQSGMGADFADVDADGRLDLFLTVFQGETNALYLNEGGGRFTEAAFPAGLAVPSLPYVSWGAVFLDYDNDGRRDLFVANGHVLDNAEQFDSSTQYRQPDQLFRNLGPGRAGTVHFADVTDRAGEAIGERHPSRGAAASDYDNDGDVDLLLLSLNDRARLLRNDGGLPGHWLGIRAVGRHGHGDAVGARVRVVAGDLVQVDQVLGAGSYLSQGDLRLSFGLGARTVVDTLQIDWPGGGRNILRGLPADRLVTIVESRR